MSYMSGVCSLKITGQRPNIPCDCSLIDADVTQSRVRGVKVLQNSAARLQPFFLLFKCIPGVLQ